MNPDALRRVLAAGLVGLGSIVAYYYGSLAYEKFCSGGFCFKTYGKIVVKVRGEMFLKWAGRLPEIAPDKNTVMQPVWINPAAFCGVRYVNEGRYIPES